MKNCDLALCNDIFYLTEQEIILYGIGFWGEKAYQILKKVGVSIKAVCTTEGTSFLFHGYPVQSICDVKEKMDYPSTLIIIASREFHIEMIQACERQAFSHAKICTLYALYQSLFLHAENKELPKSLRLEIAHNLIISEKRLEYYTKLYAFEMMLRATEEGSVLIYQPGKVGSQSIWKSSGKGSIQFHSLAIPFGCKEFPREQLDYYLYKIRNKKVKIITGVREPIARDLAAMFQNSEMDLWPFNSANSNIFWWYGDFIGREKKELSHSEIIRRSPRWRGTLQESFSRLSESIMEYKLDEFSWFHYEIKRVFDIDIYQEPFHREKGFGIIKKGQVEIFIYKLEALRGLESEIGRFLDKEGYKLENANLSENKLYYYTYKELKKTIKLSRKYFEYYYNENLEYQHFYTKKEIDIYRRMWEEHIDE